MYISKNYLIVFIVTLVLFGVTAGGYLYSQNKQLDEYKRDTALIAQKLPIMLSMFESTEEQINDILNKKTSEIKKDDFYTIHKNLIRCKAMTPQTLIASSKYYNVDTETLSAELNLKTYRILKELPPNKPLTDSDREILKETSKSLKSITDILWKQKDEPYFSKDKEKVQELFTEFNNKFR